MASETTRPVVITLSDKNEWYTYDNYTIPASMIPRKVYVYLRRVIGDFSELMKKDGQWYAIYNKAQWTFRFGPDGDKKDNLEVPIADLQGTFHIVNSVNPGREYTVDGFTDYILNSCLDPKYLDYQLPDTQVSNIHTGVLHEITGEYRKAKLVKFTPKHRV